ncbi:MAG: dTDP-4-amino-4,6-dideoxygalactose transaminase [Lachnospiraceae bacterium]|nr:dTDP-4-amino-4,6-dideoxygalactose transaminase [Lachnospiraceae bacterium]
MYKTNFNNPPVGRNAIAYLAEAIKNNHISGDGSFTRLCSEWLENFTKTNKCLLTTSCTHALEMSALLCKIKPGDEVIMPSYTFVSTANAFTLRGAKIVFVDIRPDTMNIDEKLIEAAVTSQTKAIVPVHYAGISCEMDTINEIAKRNKLFVIEDAAQGIMGSYKDKPLGTIGDFGCFSFHETKNFSMGEGGALLINDINFINEAEIIREKGTDRSRFFRGQLDKYTWQDHGSSYLPSELNAAYLWAQLEMAEEITADRLKSFNRYYQGLKALQDTGLVSLPVIPKECKHNGHMFYIKLKDINARTRLIDYLKQNKILSVFHYVPLHSSPAGQKFGRFYGEDKYTTKESERLLRLPLYYGLTDEEIDLIVSLIIKFLENKD